MTKIVNLAWQVYPGNISSFQNTYLQVCKDPHTYLFQVLKSINVLLRFRTKNFPGEVTEVFAPVQINDPIEVTTTLLSHP